MPAFLDTDSKPEKVILPISLWQPYHKLEKFRELIDLLTKNNCKEIIIIIADTLYIHNEISKDFDSEKIRTPEEIKKYLLGASEKWIKECQAVLSSIEKNMKIFHWDDFTVGESKCFSEKKNIILEKYKNEKQFRWAVDNTVEAFLKNDTNQEKKIDKENKKFQLGVDYVIEESAVLLQWADSFPSHHVIYPKKLNEAHSYLFHEIHEKDKETLKFSSVTFRKPESISGKTKVLFFDEPYGSSKKKEEVNGNKPEILEYIQSTLKQMDTFFKVASTSPEERIEVATLMQNELEKFKALQKNVIKI